MKKKFLGMALAAALFVGLGCKTTTAKSIDPQPWSTPTKEVQVSKIDPQPWSTPIIEVQEQSIDPQPW